MVAGNNSVSSGSLSNGSVSNVNDDDVLFADESDDAALVEDRAAAIDPWKILIVDDDPEVHAITRVVLGDVVFEGRRLLFLSAHSGAEARSQMRDHRDIAAILLDVVMETDDAGLQLVRFIRSELDNKQVRIILRTGQPGQAPERQVIVSYDINDYKAKSELTAQKLFTATVAALRSYQHIATIEQSRRGLEKIVESSSSLFEQRSLKRFIEGVIQQLGSLIENAQGSLLCTVQSRAEEAAVDEAEVIAGSGLFAAAIGHRLRDCVSPAVGEDIARVFREQTNLYRDQQCVILFRAHSHDAAVVYICGHRPLSEIDRRLIEIFCSKVAIGFDNVYLYEQLIKAQLATVHALGKLAEYRDEITGDHVRRIERLANLIAAKLRARGQFLTELDDLFCEQVGLASILHDVGKVGIPDAILNKPGKLDDDEMLVMRSHAPIGGHILRQAAQMVAGRNYLSLGAEIAETHHEKFDGTGYPTGLAGDAIPLGGRIVAVADVYDALIHKRPYKDAWQSESALALIREQAGRHFDPRIVDAFLAVLEDHGGVLPPLSKAGSLGS